MFDSNPGRKIFLRPFPIFYLNVASKHWHQAAVEADYSNRSIVVRKEFCVGHVRRYVSSRLDRQHYRLTASSDAAYYSWEAADAKTRQRFLIFGQVLVIDVVASDDQPQRSLP